MSGFDPFAPLGARIFAGLAAAAVAFGVVQTVRIEGAFCRAVKPGEKPACIVQGFKQELAAVRIDLELVRRERDAERAGHQATKQAYRAAQAEAERLEAERLARITARQKEANDEVVQDYERRIAAARAAAERLRRGGAGAAGSGAAGAGADLALPGVSRAAGGADAAAGDRGFSLDRRLIATEQAIRLDKWIDWAERQMALDPNAPAAPGHQETTP